MITNVFRSCNVNYLRCKKSFRDHEIDGAFLLSYRDSSDCRGIVVGSALLNRAKQQSRDSLSTLRIFHVVRPGTMAGIFVTKRHETWTISTKHDEPSVSPTVALGLG
jgi:hypothetical protein